MLQMKIPLIARVNGEWKKSWMIQDEKELSKETEEKAGQWNLVEVRRGEPGEEYLVGQDIFITPDGLLPLDRRERVPITEKDLENFFSYHAPKKDQPLKYEIIRQTAMGLAMVIIHNTPSSADQTASIRKLRECVMTANAAIACDET